MLIRLLIPLKQLFINFTLKFPHKHHATANFPHKESWNENVKIVVLLTDKQFSQQGIPARQLSWMQKFILQTSFIWATAWQNQVIIITKWRVPG